jgi:hypothetical protein
MLWARMVYRRGHTGGHALIIAIFEAGNHAGGGGQNRFFALKNKFLLNSPRFKNLLGKNPGGGPCQNMTTPWRGAAPPGRRQGLVKMGRFGRFRTKYVL